MSFTVAVGNIRLHSGVVDLPQHCLAKVKGLVIGVSLYRRFELLLSLTHGAADVDVDNEKYFQPL